ncbi:MAG: ABC transporter substrate-binding protein [Actinomycetota bacterium]|nr:ABC transporter substrate-binding protein [Actinomycetota bacterium]
MGTRFALRTVAAVAAATLIATACGSTSKTGGAPATSSSGGNSSEPTVTVGVLTDLTGPASNTSQFTPDGIKAGVALAASEGYHVKYVLADAGTNPGQALSAAQKLVEQDHVFAVIGLSAVFFSAATYLHSKGIPVIGADYDGSEWLTTDSMFSVFPYEDFTKVSTTIGEITKMLGGTNLATLGYSISPSAADTAKAYGISAQDAGIKAGYVNPDVPFGTTNVGPLVLAMKDKGIDSIFPVTDTNTGLAAIVGLRQQGVDLKVPFLAEEEGDLLAGGAATEQQSKGVDLVGLYQPPEMNTAATKEIAKYLKAGAGVSTAPTLNEYMAYLSIDALVRGLQKAGPNATQAQFIQAMEGITNYTGRGLLGSPISFAPTGRGDTAPCTFISQWTGSGFKLLPGTHPYCGTMTGQKV